MDHEETTLKVYFRIWHLWHNASIALCSSPSHPPFPWRVTNHAGGQISRIQDSQEASRWYINKWMKKRRRGYDWEQGEEESDERGNNVLKVCWDLDVHFSDFCGQTAMPNQVKNSELPNPKKRKSIEDEDDTIKVLLSRWTNMFRKQMAIQNQVKKPELAN